MRRYRKGGGPASGTVSRPSYNTGNGFFVLNGKLYDPNGNEFLHAWGGSEFHYDSNSSAGIAKSGANAVRIFVETDYGQTWSALANIVQTQHVANKEVPVITFAMDGSGTNTSCNTTTAVLTAAVNNWVNSAAVWTPFNKNSIFNLANEWGPQNSTVWRDSYISAISSLRAAGYLGPIMIDTGGCGQDANDLLNYSSAVFNSDPQKNIIFSYHVYGGYSTFTTLAGLNALAAQLAALSATDGMVFVFGEFGPGRDIGPSPTLITPAQVITAADTNGIGWLAWAWDDNDLAGCTSDDNWFSMTYHCGAYTQTSDLTSYGQDVVLNPTYGITALAKRARRSFRISNEKTVIFSSGAPCGRPSFLVERTQRPRPSQPLRCNAITRLVRAAEASTFPRNFGCGGRTTLKGQRCRNRATPCSRSSHHSSRFCWQRRR